MDAAGYFLDCRARMQAAWGIACDNDSTRGRPPFWTPPPLLDDDAPAARAPLNPNPYPDH